MRLILVGGLIFEVWCVVGHENLLKRSFHLSEKIFLQLNFPTTAYLGVQQDLHEVAVGHDELRDEVDVEVAILGVAEPLEERRGRGRAVAHFLVEVGQVQRCRLPAVVVVLVNHQDLAVVEE